MAIKMTRNVLLRTEELKIRILKEFKPEFMIKPLPYPILFCRIGKVKFCVVIHEDHFDVGVGGSSKSLETEEDVMTYLTLLYMRSICL